MKAINDKCKARFWSKVKKGPGCREWTGSRSQLGYGFVNRTLYTTGFAHRFSWILKHGKIPRGLFVLHKCDNPPCVNPKHLFLGTQRDNVLDMLVKGRARLWDAPRGELQGLSKLTSAKVKIIRKTYVPRVISQRRLAAKYKLSQSSIGAMLRRETWTHVK
jgi:hypothetical protein